MGISDSPCDCVLEVKFWLPSLVAVSPGITFELYLRFVFFFKTGSSSAQGLELAAVFCLSLLSTGVSQREPAFIAF